MSEITLTTENFESEVLNSEVPVLVDFWAPWCGPCKALGPVVSELADKHPEIRVGKVNIDEEQDLAARYRVMSIPTMILFRNGEPANQTVGLQSYESLEQFVGV